MKIAKWLFTKHNFRSDKMKMEIAEMEYTASVKMRNMTCQPHLLVTINHFFWVLLRNYWEPSTLMGVKSHKVVKIHKGRKEMWFCWTSLTQYPGLMKHNVMTYLEPLKSVVFHICIFRATGDKRTIKVWVHKLIIFLPDSSSLTGTPKD